MTRIHLLYGDDHNEASGRFRQGVDRLNARDLHLDQIRPQACVARKSIENMLIPHGSAHTRLPEDRVVSVVNALHFKGGFGNRLNQFFGVVARILTKGAFVPQILRIDLPFQYDLRGRRNRKAGELALHDFDRFAAQ